MSNEMECGCQNDYCDYDGDPPDFYDQSWRKARIIHTCCECGRDIRPGERYEYVSGKWDGDIDVYKTCEQCVAIAEEYFCDCRVHGELAVDVWNQLEVEL